MIKLLEELNLSDCRDRQTLELVVHQDPLERDHITGLRMSGFEDLSGTKGLAVSPVLCSAQQQRVPEGAFTQLILFSVHS